MTKVETIKAAIGFAVTIGTGKIVKAVIDNNVSPSGPVNKITVAAASIAIGWIITDYVKNETDKKVDEFVDSFR